MPDFLPMGQVSGISSLPHMDAEEAVAFIAEHYPAIPFWTQLPQRSEDEGSIRQGLMPLLDIVRPFGAARFRSLCTGFVVFGSTCARSNPFSVQVINRMCAALCCLFAMI